MVFPTCGTIWLSQGAQPGKHHCLLFWEVVHVSQASWTEMLLTLHLLQVLVCMHLYTSSHCRGFYFPQYLRWLKPCFMCTNVFQGLILPVPTNREGTVLCCFGQKPWHRYQTSLHLACISWCSLNSFRLRLSKSHACVYCIHAITSVLWAQCCGALPLKKVQIHPVNNLFL